MSRSSTSAASHQAGVVGFIGLGVMGEPMCRNLAGKLGDTGADRVIAFDLKPEPLTRLAEHGVEAANSVVEIIELADLIFLSLPGGEQVEAIATQAGGLLTGTRPGATVVDLSTTPVDLTRRLALQLAGRGTQFADAPVARTRQAAEQGTLAIMVGGPDEVFDTIEPYLRCFASDITHCGGHGCGQVVKILNNMVLFQTVVALAEALTVGRGAGVTGELLFDALTKGSADSFALRNHGMKALLPENFPLQAFSTRYAAKDLDYALRLATEVGRDLHGAKTARRLFDLTIEDGWAENYWPALLHVVGSAQQKNSGND